MAGRGWEIEPLHLADVVFPKWHPRSGTGPVYAFLVRNGDDAVLFDTGLGAPHELIDSLYSPSRRSLTAELAKLEASPRLIVVSHLHFDHIGGAVELAGVPIYVQRAEREAARAEHYTVPEFVDFPGASYEQVEGDAELAPGLRIIATPGHTPGHQSLAVETAEGLELIVAQAAGTAEEWQDFVSGAWRPEDAVAAASLERLAALEPVRAWFSH